LQTSESATRAPAAANFVIASRNDIENRQLMTAALNAVRHSLLQCGPNR
jgi:hypothetical protein